jgi:hypothetical protein
VCVCVCVCVYQTPWALTGGACVFFFIPHLSFLPANSGWCDRKTLSKESVTPFARVSLWKLICASSSKLLLIFLFFFLPARPWSLTRTLTLSHYLSLWRTCVLSLLIARSVVSSGRRRALRCVGSGSEGLYIYTYMSIYIHICLYIYIYVCIRARG